MSDSIATTDQPSALAVLLSDPDRLKDFPIETVERLFALDREMKADQERREFFAAFHAVQSEMRPVVKRAPNTHTRSKYAYISDVAEMLDPLLDKHGFSRSLGSQECPQPNHVRCVLILRHNGGHEEKHILDAPFDGAGAKGRGVMTPIQGMVSARTYCERVLLCNVWGVTLISDDGDGNNPKNLDKISEHQEKEIHSLMSEVQGNVTLFLEVFGVTQISDLTVANYDPAIRMLEAKR